MNPITSVHRKSQFLSILVAALTALVPKCPLCCSIYAGIFSALGIAGLPFYNWIFTTLMALLLVNLFALGIFGRKRRKYAPFFLSLLGVMAILFEKLSMESNLLLVIGVLLVVASALLNIGGVGKWHCEKS